MPTLLRFVLCHAAAGFGLSALLVGGLILTNPGQAGTLLLGAAGHWWPAALLWFFVGLTFGGAQLAGAVMSLGPEGRPGRPGGGRGAPGGLVPVALRARAPRRH